MTNPPAPAPAPAPTAPALDAHASDPIALGWMQGSPPAADKRVSFADGTIYRFPQLRWSFCNMRQLVPTTNVPRGSAPVSSLPVALRDDIDTLSFTPIGQQAPMTWAEAFHANYTDGIVVLHRGRIVHERHAGALRPDGVHIAMSVTKSFFGLIGAMLVAEGRLDEHAPVAEHVPELRDSAFGDATVRQVLDMRTGLAYSEDYTDPKAEIWAHVRAGGVVMPRPAGYDGPHSFYAFLQTVKKQGKHGGAFAYKTVNTDALGWVIRRVTGRSVGQNLAERIWMRLGMESDACISVDCEGTEFAGGGLNANLRDLARFGELMRLEGRWGGQQVLPAAVVADIAGGGERSAFTSYPLLKGWSYRNMWWVSHNEHGAYMARGVHGQALYIDPTAEMVIARFGSHPVAPNAANDPTTLPAFHALGQHLMRS
jgi:CubicO group peptidase (beta-lactamase class C family)